MDRKTQRGEGKLGGIVALLVVAGVIYAAVNAGPAYLAHYQLKDYMLEVARLPRATATDEKILDRLDTYVRKEELADYITRSNFRITTREGGRTISVSYERSVKFLPGVERLLARAPVGSQHMLFSATLDDEVDGLVDHSFLGCNDL